MVTLPPQRFPFGRDNLKNILVRPFKFGMWVYMAMPQMLLFCDLDLQFQGHWWPLKGHILAIFFTFWPSSHIQKVRSSYGWYTKYIYMSSVSMQEFDLEALH